MFTSSRDLRGFRMALTRRVALAATATLAMATTSRAQARWQAACAFPEGNFHTRTLRGFLDEVTEITGVQVQLHSNGSLLPMPQIKRGVQTGQVQVGEILISAYGNEDPFFEI